MVRSAILALFGLFLFSQNANAITVEVLCVADAQNRADEHPEIGLTQCVAGPNNSTVCGNTFGVDWLRVRRAGQSWHWQGPFFSNNQGPPPFVNYGFVAHFGYGWRVHPSYATAYRDAKRTAEEQAILACSNYHPRNTCVIPNFINGRPGCKVVVHQ